MLIHIERFKVAKDDGHVAYFDRYYDKETLVEYYGADKFLVMRTNSDGSPVIYRPTDA